MSKHTAELLTLDNADQGYLFYIANKREHSKPMIYVWDWQPQRFNNGHIINLSDFTC